jgi:hypothetical protein
VIVGAKQVSAFGKKRPNTACTRPRYTRRKSAATPGAKTAAHNHFTASSLASAAAQPPPTLAA